MSKKICVFCGANKGRQQIYTDITRELAQIFIDQKITLVYGGAKIGLMGEMADTVLAGGGEVIGVMPRLLVDKEVSHKKITELHIVDTMAERKQVLMDLSDGFILLPGGLGSLDEFFEVLTLAQLGLHNKPSGILNVAGYYDDMLKFLENSIQENFVNHSNYSKIIIENDPVKLTNAIINYNEPMATRWDKVTTLIEA